MAFGILYWSQLGLWNFVLVWPWEFCTIGQLGPWIWYWSVWPLRNFVDVGIPMRSVRDLSDVHLEIHAFVQGFLLEYLVQLSSTRA